MTELPERVLAALAPMPAGYVGLLRTVGPTYQFRHADLRDVLAGPDYRTSEKNARTSAANRSGRSNAAK